MDIERFMRGYKAAWEGRDEALFCALFAGDGIYRNTPFAAQRGHAELAQYWQRVKLQEDVVLSYEILSASPAGRCFYDFSQYEGPILLERRQ